MTSFCVQLENLGRGLLRKAKRREGGWAVLVEAKGDKKEYFGQWGHLKTKVLLIRFPDDSVFGCFVFVSPLYDLFVGISYFHVR